MLDRVFITPLRVCVALITLSGGNSP